MAQAADASSSSGPVGPERTTAGLVSGQAAGASGAAMLQGGLTAVLSSVLQLALRCSSWWQRRLSSRAACSS